MGIDGIGKPSGAGPSTPVASQVAGGALREFAVDAAPNASPAEAAGSAVLARLQRGEIGIDEYLDAKVEEATVHLGSLPEEQLDYIRVTLRSELRNDPVLVELVRRTTGSTPPDLDR